MVGSPFALMSIQEVAPGFQKSWRGTEMNCIVLCSTEYSKAIEEIIAQDVGGNLHHSLLGLRNYIEVRCRRFISAGHSFA